MTPPKKPSRADRLLARALEQRDACTLHRALARGADLDRQLGPTGWTPLHKACADGWLAGVELITGFPGAKLPLGADSAAPPRNVLCLAAPHGLLLVQFLIKQGFQIWRSEQLQDVCDRLPEAHRDLWRLLWRPK